MRRRDREIKDIAGILEILDECRVIRIAVSDEEGLYIVPVNFGYEYSAESGLELIIHSAKEGRKISALKRDNRASFEADCSHELIEGGTACDYSYRYKSVTGSGRAYFIEDRAEKRAALSVLMRHQTGKESWEFSDKMLDATSVIRIKADKITGKERS